MIASFAAAIAVGLQVAEKPLVAFVCDPDNKPDFSVLTETNRSEWALKNHMRPVEVDKPRATIYFSELVAPLESLRLAASFYKEASMQPLLAFAGNSPLGRVAAQRLANTFGSQIPASANERAYGLRLEVRIKSSGLDAPLFSYIREPKVEPYAGTPVEVGSEGLQVARREPSLRLVERTPPAWMVQFPAGKTPMVTDANLAVATAWQSISEDLVQLRSEARQAYLSLKSALVNSYFPGMSGSIPGKFKFGDLPEAIRQHLLETSKSDPGALGFASSQDFDAWLATNPTIDLNPRIGLIADWKDGEIGRGIGVDLTGPG